MRSSYAALLQSKYFNPAFNSAIFDGPVRIYFAQFHESLALKIYFLMQQKLVAELQTAKEHSKILGTNVLLMIYPTAESFGLSFESASDSAGPFVVENWQQDVVIGLRGPIEDEDLEGLMAALRLTLNTWGPAPLQESAATVEL